VILYVASILMLQLVERRAAKREAAELAAASKGLDIT
jgi:hypothetical protein